VTLKFGTDGIRGPASELTDPYVFALGRAAARVLGGQRFLIARDTRESGPRLEAALAAGLRAERVEPEFLGVAPTPALAWVAAAHDLPAAMISASHNPFDDNGIKFFAAGGTKLADAVETLLELELDSVLTSSDALLAPGAIRPGGLVRADDVERYGLGLVASLDGRDLKGMHVVIDCANGAQSSLAPRVLERLGATVTVLHDQPDGRNINAACGSTHPDDLAATVVASGAMVGLAFDGDADRVLAVDETGAVVDGDHLIAMCAIDRHARGALAHDTVVVTVMTNLGFRLAMAERGINVVETPVGDRYVLEAMAAGGFNLGGEQSGHVVFGDLATTGDGLLTGLAVLDLMQRTGLPLSRLAADAMTRLPQVLVNVAVPARDPRILEAVAPQVAEAEARLGADGRVLVRASGTEPLIRVMVEATHAATAAEVAEALAAAVTEVADA
jgi:phosphoglucosamine mutase